MRSLLDRLPRDKQALVLIAVVAVAVRLAAIPLLGTGWAAEDLAIAEQIAAGNGFQAPSLYGGELRPTSQKSPGVPYLLALSLWLSPGAPRAGFMVLQAFAAGLGCWWTGLLGRRLFGAHTGLLAAALLAVFVPHIWWMRHIGHHVFAAAAISGTLLLLYRARAHDRVRDDVAWGAALGAAGYFSSDVLLPAPLLALWLAWRRREQGLGALRGPLLAGVAAFAVLAPWTVRNFQVHDAFVLVRTGFGTALYWGNNSQATGTDWVIEQQPDGTVLYVPGLYKVDPELLARLTPLSEVEQEAVLQGIAWQWIRDNPGAAARLWLRKLGYFWWFTRIGDIDPVPWLRDLAWGAVLLLALLGVRRAVRERNEPGVLLPLVAPLLTTTLVHVTTVVSSNWRMRIPIEPIVLLFAAHGLVAVLAIIRHAGSRQDRPARPAATGPDTRSA